LVANAKSFQLQSQHVDFLKGLWSVLPLVITNP
jgi:hypothetical protein